MTDHTELKAKAEIDAQCNERFTNISPSDLLELIADLEKIDADRKACWAEFKVQGRYIDRLKDENKALLKDADRYRFMRGQGEQVIDVAAIRLNRANGYMTVITGDVLDSQIDILMDDSD